MSIVHPSACDASRMSRARLASTSTSLRAPRHPRFARTPRAVAKPTADAMFDDDPAAWERFYLTHSRDRKKGHEVSAFKDRHYLRREFSELVDDDARRDPAAFRAALDPATLPDVDDALVIDVVEFGCGVGNSAYPMMRANLNMRVIAVDCSPTAIEAVKRNPEYDERRVRAEVVDASKPGSLEGVCGDASVDGVTAVFFLSALSKTGLRNAAKEIRRILKPTGALLFRDYARGDVKHEGDVKNAKGDAVRFEPGEKIDEQAYRRADGTLAVFFDSKELEEEFASVGLLGTCEVVTHTVTNRKLGVTMERRFVQGRFVPGDARVV